MGNCDTGTLYNSTFNLAPSSLENQKKLKLNPYWVLLEVRSL